MNRHLKGDPEYVDPAHPLQTAIRAAFEEVTGEQSPGYGIDGCSAPNFATSVHGLARAMARFATAREDGDARSRAAHRLTHAMATHPEMVAGEGRACTELMRAMGGRVAIKTGAEAVFVAILPDQKKGIALKVTDGGTRGAEAAICALLVKLGALDPNHPATLKRLDAVQKNWRGIETGMIRTAPGFP
jgi:L-asparaginase II